jgi:hypothetical protein
MDKIHFFHDLFLKYFQNMIKKKILMKMNNISQF